MSDRRLQVFHAVAKMLSFTRAAETLHMTQPAVTFQVRQLEDQFKARLFDRTHSRISLTEAGSVAFGYAGEILGLYAEMEQAVRDVTGNLSGHLVLGASTTIAEYLLPALLSQFTSRYPEATVSLKVSNTDGIVAMVEDNTIDLGIVEAPADSGNLQVEVCREDELVVIVAPDHELATKSRLRAEELQGYPFISREEGSGTRDVVNSYLSAQGAELDAVDMFLDMGSPEAVKGAVEAGLGISVVSHTILSKELRLGTLRAIPLDPPLLRPLSFIRKKQRFRVSVMSELLECARLLCEQQPGASYLSGQSSPMGGSSSLGPGDTSASDPQRRAQDSEKSL